MSRKPSKSAVRVLTILAYIEGAVSIVETEHTNPLLKNRVEYTRMACSVASHEWEVIGDSPELIEALRVNLVKITGELNKIWWLTINTNMNYPGMCYIAMQLLDDLMALITDPRRSLWLQNIYDALTILIDHVDPEGEMILTQDRAQEVTKAIYSVAGEK